MRFRPHWSRLVPAVLALSGLAAVLAAWDYPIPPVEMRGVVENTRHFRKKPSVIKAFKVTAILKGGDTLVTFECEGGREVFATPAEGRPRYWCLPDAAAPLQKADFGSVMLAAESRLLFPPLVFSRELWRAGRMGENRGESVHVAEEPDGSELIRMGMGDWQTNLDAPIKIELRRKAGVWYSFTLLDGARKQLEAVAEPASSASPLDGAPFASSYSVTEWQPVMNADPWVSQHTKVSITSVRAIDPGESFESLVAEATKGLTHIPLAHKWDPVTRTVVRAAPAPPPNVVFVDDKSGVQTRTPSRDMLFPEEAAARERRELARTLGVLAGVAGLILGGLWLYRRRTA